MPPSLDLSPAFQHAFTLLEKEHKNVFLTGKAGTGKSTFLKYFLENTTKNCVVLAPTGVAALNVGGATIHSFFRFPPHITEQEVIQKAKSTGPDSIYRQIDLMIIDEISMVRADLLDHIDLFLRGALHKKQPFGGVQILFVGDLYQLPPVVKSDERAYFEETYESPFFFSSRVMTDRDFELTFVELEKIYRQSDQTFIDILNAVRNRTVTEEHLDRLHTRLDPAFESNEHITLTSTNDLADRINALELDKLPGKSISYLAGIKGEFPSGSFPTEESLTLKKGARIMFLNNDSAGRWVNGTLGTILDLDKEALEVQLENGATVEVEPHTWEVKRYVYDGKAKKLDTEPVGSFRQMPVRLAWAVTIHKSQGKTFERVIVDTGRGVFAHGQMYVALSRCTTLEGLVLRKPLKENQLLIDYRVIRFLTRFQYEIAEKNMSLEDKIELLQRAKKEKIPVAITYLKAQDVKSKRTILVKKVGQEEYLGKPFLGVRAFCLTRQEERVFRVDRILEMKLEKARE